jgi:hypothetical protein
LIFVSDAALPGQAPGKSQIVRFKVENGDTIYMATIPEVYILPKRKYKNKRMEARYARLVHNIKKVYPYVVILREEFGRMNQEYLHLKTAKERRNYTRNLEKTILKKFEKDLKKLTITQGRLLIKLVDRETGNTSYEVLKDFRGGLSAVFWQGVARIFGTNLKTPYDPEGTDQEIEEILILIETGFL